MTYNIRHLAIYIGTLKVCNVCYILSYKNNNIELYTRNAVKYMYQYNLNYGLIGQQLVLNIYLQSEMILTIFTILFGVVIVNSL